eukprot:55397-Eustigmatos_ZCMA.PRE.1
MSYDSASLTTSDIKVASTHNSYRLIGDQLVRFSIGVCACVCSVAGCASFGPDQVQHPRAVPVGYDGGGHQAGTAAPRGR